MELNLLGKENFGSLHLTWFTGVSDPPHPVEVLFPPLKALKGMSFFFFFVEVMQAR